MNSMLFWLYFANAILLIEHELDSAYWQEWNLFKLPGGLVFFLLVHLPLLAALLFGMILLERQLYAGLFFSLFVSLVGIFAFGIHTFFLLKGRPEFNTLMSRTLLWMILIVSVVQMSITVFLMV